MQLSEDDVRTFAMRSATRQDFWIAFLEATGAEIMAEVGVYRGDFAARLLANCALLRRYYMIDPWRHLDDWDKPANREDDVFEVYYQEVLDKTSAFAEKRLVLRGRTLDVIDQIEDGELDFAYLDGDHTLRGITTDLTRVYPKIREGGWLGGDDFCRSIFQHSRKFEPTLVFPFAVYFAEAVGARIYALPHKQFLMQKRGGDEHSFIDLTGRYSATTLKPQIMRRDRKRRASRLRTEPTIAAPTASPVHGALRRMLGAGR
jgi:hypothetical protein